MGFYRAGLAQPRANPTSSLVQSTPRRAIPLQHCCNMFTLPSQPFRCLVPQVENSLNSQSTVPFPLLALQYHRAEPVNLTLKEKSCAQKKKKNCFSVLEVCFDEVPRVQI